MCGMDKQIFNEKDKCSAIFCWAGMDMHPGNAGTNPRDRCVCGTFKKFVGAEISTNCVVITANCWMLRIHYITVLKLSQSSNWIEIY